jgi:hypothetical protein
MEQLVHWAAQDIHVRGSTAKVTVLLVSISTLHAFVEMDSFSAELCIVSSDVIRASRRAIEAGIDAQADNEVDVSKRSRMLPVISATFSREAVEMNSEFVRPGALVLLKSVSVVSTTARSHSLVVCPNNVVYGMFPA